MQIEYRTPLLLLVLSLPVQAIQTLIQRNLIVEGGQSGAGQPKE